MFVLWTNLVLIKVAFLLLFLHLFLCFVSVYADVSPLLSR